jgi:hypothetical protein
MTAMLHSRPIVTSSGHLTENIWQRDCGLQFIPWGSENSRYIEAIENLILNDKERDRAGQRASSFYQDNFSITQLIGQLSIE